MHNIFHIRNRRNHILQSGKAGRRVPARQADSGILSHNELKRVVAEMLG